MAGNGSNVNKGGAVDSDNSLGDGEYGASGELDGHCGIAYLVGAGPGDPGLLTLRGRECLERADIIFYDYLSSAELLAYAPAGAERVCVGKIAGAHSVPQEETTQMLVRAVAAGKTAVRLKGGDPFIFGRGGEEAQALAHAGLRFEVVPGVTSGVAAAAYAGIPLTHRGMAVAVTLLTGHESPDKPESQHNWAALAQGGQTLCIYMGTGNLRQICEKLVANGRPATEPAAIIQQGTTPAQRTVCGNLDNLADHAQEAGICAPALIVVGQVVTLREELAWFDRRPLSGRRIVVTRSRAQAGTLSTRLAEQGAQVLEMPAIVVQPVACLCSDLLRDALEAVAGAGGRGMPLPGPLLDGCDSLTRGVARLAAAEVDYVVFTSANGVEQTFARLAEFGLDARVFRGMTLAAIGPGTAQELLRNGLRADLVPEVFTGEGLLAELAGRDIAGRRFLLLRAEQARDLLPDGLRTAGASVEDLTAYRLERVELDDQARQDLLEGGVDAVTFASGGTAHNFFEALGPQIGLLCDSPHRPVFASIGPVTSQALRERGLPVDVESPQATIPALVAALVGYFSRG